MLRWHIVTKGFPLRCSRDLGLESRGRRRMRYAVDPSMKKWNKGVVSVINTDVGWFPPWRIPR